MAMTSQPSHERVAKLHGAYTAFIAAAIISLISGDGHIKSEDWAICLWALSLPWLISFLLLDYIVRERQKREKSAIRGFTSLLGYGFSNLGTAALLTHYSWLVAIIYVVTILICAIYIHEVASLGWNESYRDL